MKSALLDPFIMPDNFNLFLWGDTQWGNVGTREKGIDKMFDMMESEYRGVPAKWNYAAHMGDHLEGIVVGDPRFAFDQLLPKKTFLRAMIDHAIERESVIRKKTLFILNGNHEWKWINTYGDIGREIADRLEVPYGLRSCVARFHRKKTGNFLFRGHHHHGFGSLRSNAKDHVQREANMKAALKDRLRRLFDGAVYHAMGHTHQLMVVEPDTSVKILAEADGILRQSYPLSDPLSTVDQSSSYIPPDSRWYVNTGSFLQTYTEEGVSYAEQLGLPPVELGFIVGAVRDCKLVKFYKEVV